MAMNYLTKIIPSRRFFGRLTFFIVVVLMLFAVTRKFQQAMSNPTNHFPSSKSSPRIKLARNLGNNDFVVKHHTDLDTHRLQMKMSLDSSSSKLHQIMSKQFYDVPYGLYEGSPYKKILYWNFADVLPFGRENCNFGMGVGRDRFKSAGCPVWQCETSEDRSNLLEFDAIIFNQMTFNLSDLPKVRSPHQRYIFESIESAAFPNNYVNAHRDQDETLAAMAGFFNWTMTYRLDSDIVHPYGWIEPNDPHQVPLHPGPEEYKRLVEQAATEVNHAVGKTKMAVFIASNCNSYSNREELVFQLIASGVQVDRYGRCGNETCGLPYYDNQTGNAEQSKEEYCLGILAKDHKFIFAFQNSLCLDFTSERFYDAVRFPIIPIVLDTHGHHAKVAPPHSFINALDFPTVHQLANYLIKLDKNDTLYNEYFWWKNHYRVRNAELYSGIHHRTYCSICHVLHNPSPRPDFQVYSDMKSWWQDKSDCQTMYFDGFYSSRITN